MPDSTEELVVSALAVDKDFALICVVVWACLGQVVQRIEVSNVNDVIAISATSSDFVVVLVLEFIVDLQVVTVHSERITGVAIVCTQDRVITVASDCDLVSAGASPGGHPRPWGISALRPG